MKASAAVEGPQDGQRAPLLTLRPYVFWQTRSSR